MTQIKQKLEEFKPVGVSNCPHCEQQNLSWSLVCWSCGGVLEEKEVGLPQSQIDRDDVLEGLARYCERSGKNNRSFWGHRSEQITAAAYRLGKILRDLKAVGASEIICDDIPCGPPGSKLLVQSYKGNELTDKTGNS